MSSVVMEKELWPGRRWAWVLVVLFAGQLLAIWWYAEKDRAPRERTPRPAVESLVFSSQMDAASESLLALEDPAIFSIPRPNNFSGHAWLNAVAMEHPWKDWVEKQGGVALNAEDLGRSFMLSLGNHSTTGSMVEKPETALTLALVDEGPVRTQSVMRLEGGLAGLKLENKGDLPGWTNAETLLPTTVEMGVGSDGLPHAVRLLERCGLVAADQYAVNAAWKLRFAPANLDFAASPVLTWGYAVFQWQTLMVAPTNGATAAH